MNPKKKSPHKQEPFHSVATPFLKLSWYRKDTEYVFDPLHRRCKQKDDE